MTVALNSRTAPSGRFIYAACKSRARAEERFEDMCCEGEMSPCEGRIERISDHSGRLVAYAITIA